jgi:hypothetical protein
LLLNASHQREREISQRHLEETCSEGVLAELYLTKKSTISTTISPTRDKHHEIVIYQ